GVSGGPLRILHPPRRHLPLHEQPRAVRDPCPDLSAATGVGAMIRLLKRGWFGLSLVSLLLLALPGLFLFFLNLIGRETEVNKFLEEKFNLTYHIPVAWWATLLLFLVPPLLILLYFLKLKRKPLSVPSTFLWKKSIEDLHVNALFQWLRQNLLLLLQLLALLLMIYAIMDFRVYGRTSEGKHYILMIDNSASMSAT